MTLLSQFVSSLILLASPSLWAAMSCRIERRPAVSGEHHRARCSPPDHHRRVDPGSPDRSKRSVDTMIEHAMTTTAFTLDGYRIAKTLGVVRGVTVRSRSVFGTIGGASTKTRRLSCRKKWPNRNSPRNAGNHTSGISMSSSGSAAGGASVFSCCFARVRAATSFQFTAVKISSRCFTTPSRLAAAIS